MRKGEKKKTGRIFTVLMSICVVAMTVVIAVAFVRGGQCEETAEVAEIAKASLPTISMSYEGQTLNCLQGYTTSMDMTKLDMVLTPILENKQLPVTVRLFDNKLTAVDCLIYSKAGEDPIEQRHTDNPTVSEADGERTAQLTFDLSNAISSTGEYLLEIRLTTSANEMVYYYTRVQTDSDTRTINTAEALSFALTFCKNTFDASASEEVAKYLETSSVSSETAYAHVDLHAETEQVTWGTLGAKQYGEPTVDLLELDDTGALLSIDYQMTVQEDEETNSYYLVHEYYRLYRNETRMCLIEFDRTVTETFLGTQLAVGGQSLSLGILPDEVEYVYSDDETLAVWEQAGELWEYDTDGGDLYKIFTMQDTTQGDVRAYMQNYDIHILKVSNNGNVDFVVSGYANRGAYEGTSGMQLYRFTARSNAYETLYAVTDDRDPALVRADISELSYLSGTDFYYYLRGALWHADLDKGTTEAVETALSADMLVTGGNGRYVTWASDPDASTSLSCMDLKKDKQHTIDAGEDAYIRPIGYVNDDLVYGLAKKSAVTKSGTGSIYFLMDTVRICDSSGETIKEYTDETLPVTGGTTTDELITLTRVTAAEDGGYTETQSHQIVNAQDEEDEEETPLTTTYSDTRGQQMTLNLPVACAGELHRYTAEEVLSEDSISAKELSAENETSLDGLFYVYDARGLAGCYCDSRQAFLAAQADGCRLKNGTMRTLYYQMASVEAADVEASTFDPTTADGDIVSAWQEQEKEKTVADATGISFELLLRMVGQGASALVKTGAGQYRYLTAYTESTVTFTDVQTGQAEQMSAGDAQALYERYGSACVMCK